MIPYLLSVKGWKIYRILIQRAQTNVIEYSIWCSNYLAYSPKHLDNVYYFTDNKLIVYQYQKFNWIMYESKDAETKDKRSWSV